MIKKLRKIKPLKKAILELENPSMLPPYVQEEELG